MRDTKKLPLKGCVLCVATSETKCVYCKKTWRQHGPLGVKNKDLRMMWYQLRGWNAKTSGHAQTDADLIHLFGDWRGTKT